MAFDRARTAVICFPRYSFVVTSSFYVVSRVFILILSLTILGVSVIAASSNLCLRVVIASLVTVLM